LRFMATIGAFALLLGLGIVPSLLGSAEPGGARPAFVSELWGGISAPQGWGFTAPSITNPGPTITVAPGELVDLTLNSIDVGHRFHVDLDGNNASNPGEPLSTTFFPSPGGTPFSFNAPLSPGAWWYRCAIHGFGQQRGVFRVVGNSPPSATLTNPGGPAQTWTGGSSHAVMWTMSDPESPTPTLTVYVNYTSSAGSGTIAGPLTGLSSPALWPWPVPPVDVADMLVSVEVLDPSDAKASDAELVPNVDSTPPTVAGTVPPDSAPSVDPSTTIEVTFSEPMNQGEAELSLSLCAMPGCTPVPLNPIGWTGDTLRMQPAAPLAADTDHEATVSIAAEDASNPGNPLAAPFVWPFRTRNASPSITGTLPGGGERWTGGTTHSVTWTSSDPENLPGTLTVWINYSATGVAPWSPVAGPVPGDSSPFSWPVPTDDTVAARLNFTVVDTSGATGSFVTAAFEVDSTAPAVIETDPAPDAPGVFLNANMVVTFDERMNAGAVGDPDVVALFAVAAATWVPMGYQWDGTERILTANPVADLAPTVHYRLFVNGTALDASDPGNAMGIAYTTDFNTSATADLSPPEITHTPPNAHITVSARSPISITATVTDAGSGVAVVRINYTDVNGDVHNVTMTVTTGDTYGFDIPDPDRAGTISYFLYAEDGLGNGNRTATFTLTVHADETPGAGDLTALIVAAILLVVAAVAAAALLLRRRQKREQAPPSPPS